MVLILFPCMGAFSKRELQDNARSWTRQSVIELQYCPRDMSLLRGQFVIILDMFNWDYVLRGLIKRDDFNSLNLSYFSEFNMNGT